MPFAQPFEPGQHLSKAFFLLFLCALLLTACDTSSPTPPGGKSTVSTNNGPITYSTNASDVILRTFFGGGNLGTFAFSPAISIYGDGTYILGPGLDMRQGKLDAATLQQLLHTLVDTDGLLSFSRQVFNDIPDQNATFLQLLLNNKQFTYQYGNFGSLQESASDIAAYHHLDAALTTITTTLNGPTHSYRNSTMAFLVHQDFSPNLTQTIPQWTFHDFSLYQLAAYECGLTPIDQTGPNADTGCLTYTIPHVAYLPNSRQLLEIKTLFRGQLEGEFVEQGLYYRAALRPLLPDEVAQKVVAMFGSQQFSYTAIPLRSGVVPAPTPTP